jgi:phosphatidate cytidylyltransferase
VNDIIKRSVTGIIIIALILAGVSVNQFTFMIVFTIILVSGLWEFYQIFEKSGKNPQKNSGIISGVIIFGIGYLIATGNTKLHLMAVLVAVVLYIVIAELFRKHNTPFENITITFFGIVYIAVPISLLWYLAFRDNICHYNRNLILGYFFLIWTNDTMAYLTGITIGKNKLLERISPKKTWEGVVGGFIFCIGIAYIISLFFSDLTTWQWITYGSIIAVFGTIGDLAESMLKRSADIKDSGTLLPGHGGILDRFDSLFLAVPAVYLYLQFI